MADKALDGEDAKKQSKVSCSRKVWETRERATVIARL